MEYTKEKIEEERVRNKLFNFRPVLFSAIFLAIGTYFGFEKCKGVSVWWAMCLCPVMAAASVFFSRGRERLSAAFVCALLLIGSFFAGYFGINAQMDAYMQAQLPIGECYVRGTVTEKREYNTASGFVLADISINGQSKKEKILVYLPDYFYDNIELSDEIVLQGTCEKINIEDSFSMQANAFGDKIYYRMYAEDAIVTGNHFGLFRFLRSRAEQVIDAGMDITAAALTKAVLFGDKAGIESGLYENIRYGGIAHIFAVSGLHIGALFAFCLLLIEKTPIRVLHKTLRWILMALVIITYAGICGFASSVARASIMCLLAYAAKLFLVKKDSLELLGAAWIVILLFTPSSLYEIGFQLSFAACFGIAFLAKWIGHVLDEIKNRLFSKQNKEAEKDAPLSVLARIWRSVVSFLSVSLAAQIATAPFQLYYFGYVSGWARILNCVFVPFIGVMFPILLALVVIACITPIGFAPFWLYLPNMIWSVMILPFYIADFSNFALKDVSIKFSAMLPYFMTCVFLSDKWNLSKFLRVGLILLCLCTFGLSIMVLN